MSKSDVRFTVEQFFDFLRKIFASVFRLHKLCISSIATQTLLQIALYVQTFPQMLCTPRYVLYIYNVMHLFLCYNYYITCVCILTTLNIYGSVLSIKPYDIVNFTHEDITITCISYCDSRNISFSWIR